LISTQKAAPWATLGAAFAFGGGAWQKALAHLAFCALRHFRGMVFAFGDHLFYRYNQSRFPV